MTGHDGHRTNQPPNPEPTSLTPPSLTPARPWDEPLRAAPTSRGHRHVWRLTSCSCGHPLDGVDLIARVRAFNDHVVDSAQSDDGAS